MGSHIVHGQFKSDKYAWSEPGFVPLKTSDKMGQDLLFEYSKRRRNVDAEFSDDLEASLKADGFDPMASVVLPLTTRQVTALVAAIDLGIRSGGLLEALGETDDDVALIEAFVKLKLLTAEPEGDLK